MSDIAGLVEASSGRRGFGLRNNRRGTPALPFCRTVLKAKKPVSHAYPKTLKTLGDHLRKNRLDRKLLQKDVAEQLGVSEMTVHNWETNLSTPMLSYIPKILKFIGYIPSELSASDIKACRQALGITQEALAKKIGIDPGTLAKWEAKKIIPSIDILKFLNNLLLSLYCSEDN